MRDDRVYLAYIAESIDLVQRYLALFDSGLDEQRFLNDPFTQDAVLRRLETLADAASHLSQALKGQHPEVPWRRVTDFRNVLAHGYTDLDLSLIWRTIVEDLPVLQQFAADEGSRPDASG